MSAKSVAIVLSTESDSVHISKGNSVTLRVGGKSEKLSFDGAYYAKDSEQTYQNYMKTIPDDVLSGNNVNVVCLGPRGDGVGQVLGSIIPYLTNDLYSKTGATKHVEHLLSASMLQIDDKGELLDLLNPHTRKMQIKQSQHLGTYVDCLSGIICPNADAACCLFSEGQKMDSSLNKPSRTTVFTIYVSQRQRGDVAPKGISSKISIFGIVGHDPERLGLKAIFKSAGKGKPAKDATSSVASSLLYAALTVGNTPSIIGCVSSEENESQINMNILQTTKSLSGFRSSPQRNSTDLENLLLQMRQDIKVIRGRMMHQTQPSKKDISNLDELLAELSAAKRTGWEQRITLSNQFVEERRTNLADRGMLWILDAGNTPGHAAIKELQNKVDNLVGEYKEQRKISDGLKENLKSEIEQYSKLVESGKSDEKDAKARVVKIQQMKESFKQESEKTEECRKKVKAAKELLRKEKEAGLDVTAFNFEMTARKLEEDRKRMKQDNQQMVNEELENMKLEVEHEKVELEMRASTGQLPHGNDKEVVQNASDLMTIKAEKSVITTQLDALKKENKQLEEHVRILAEKHAKEVEMQQLQNLQTFRAYREVFEEFKVELENRWRGLLDDAIQDAVFLNSRNNELSQDNQKLKLEVNEQKDKLSIAGIAPGNKSTVTGIKEM